jgi:hypothetical protein
MYAVTVSLNFALSQSNNIFLSLTLCLEYVLYDFIFGLVGLILHFTNVYPDFKDYNSTLENYNFKNILNETEHQY